MDVPGLPQNKKRKRDDDSPIKHRISRACLPCRRRKIRCNGARPFCQNCLRLKDECKWSVDGDPEVVLHDESNQILVTDSQHRVLVDLFFSVPHLSIMRQSIHRPSFESIEVRELPPFLLATIYCLSALYISEADSKEIFNGESAMNLSDRLASSAQKYSRDTSDQPTVSSTQANLILGFRELLCRTGYKAWMYIGVAIRMSQALRLGREYHQQHSAREQEIRRRTLWTCFIMDRLSSVFCSRPQTLDTDKLRTLLPCSEASFFFEEAPPGPRSYLDAGPDPGSQEVYPFLIKAVEYWGIMVDIFASGLQNPPSAPDDTSSKFYKTETTIKLWMENLPSRMRWSTKNYKTHRLLGQGSMFVEFHFILNHALCVAHQEYLPEYEGDLTFGSPISVEPSGQSRVLTCLNHADEITGLAKLLYEGDEVDKQLLQGSFSGLALETAACCHLWRIFWAARETSPEGQCPLKTPAGQKIAFICEVLKTWEDVWPIAASWGETIELLSRLYEAAHPIGILTFDMNKLKDQEDQEERDMTVGSGKPDPRILKISRISGNVRHILMTVSDPSSLRHHQTRLHIQSIWDKMFMLQESDRLMDTAATQAVPTAVPSEYNDISNFGDLLNFMDNSEGITGSQYDSITISSQSVPNQQHPSPNP